MCRCITADAVKGLGLVGCSATDKAQHWSLIPRDVPSVPSAGLAQLYILGTQLCLTRPTGSNPSDPAAGKGLSYALNFYTVYVQIDLLCLLTEVSAHQPSFISRQPSSNVKHCL